MVIHLLNSLKFSRLPHHVVLIMLRRFSDELVKIVGSLFCADQIQGMFFSKFAKFGVFKKVCNPSGVLVISCYMDAVNLMEAPVGNYIRKSITKEC